ncbi:MAG: hypothetical protein Q8R36_01940 [bacterium]|nr:hypothetical protein [bacterium]
MDKRGEGFLGGALVNISLSIKSQTGRKKGQDLVEWMSIRLFKGCLQAYERLGDAAHYVSTMEIVFPPHDGEVFVWPSVFVVLSVPQANSKMGELNPISMKFESFSADQHGERPKISEEIVAERITTAVRNKLTEHGATLGKIAKEIPEAIKSRF